jgi:hypothetical protein
VAYANISFRNRSIQVTFHINRNLTINEIAELASLAKNTPLADRVGRLYVSTFRLAEDRQRDAFMFETGAVARETGGQNHYLLYFMRHWFDIRSKNAFSAEVSFYDFPANLEADRKWIEQCFGQAARIYGWNYDGGDELPIFDPVFCPDDWHPGYI